MLRRLVLNPASSMFLRSPPRPCSNRTAARTTFSSIMTLPMRRTVGEAQLAHLPPCVTHDACTLSKLSRTRRDGERAEIVHARGFRAGELRVRGLIAPGDGAEAAGFRPEGRAGSGDARAVRRSRPCRIIVAVVRRPRGGHGASSSTRRPSPRRSSAAVSRQLIHWQDLGAARGRCRAAR